MRLKRELEAGWFQHMECSLPAVLTIQSGINKVRYATLKGIMAAKKKEIAVITRESLGASSESTQRVLDEADVLLGGARAVGVLDPQDEPAPLMTGVEPVEERGPGAADVQVARW